ncbi:MAG: oxidoreductase [Anaerolineales bacterium]|nr:MAG: oxidoreductase [Anaerolineales bacterium]
MKRLKVGVIGLGRMGQHHCRVYANSKEVDFKGVFDTNSSATRDLSERYDVPGFQRIEDLLEQIDAVSIVTPTPTHFDIAMQCLEKNVNILIEKPVTDDLDSAQLLMDAAEMNGLVVQVGHIERFNPTYIELKKVLESLKVIAINFRRLSPYRVSNKDVDVVFDLMVHDLDLSNDLTEKEPISINAQGLMPFSNSLDHVVAQLFYNNGPLITLTASRVTEQKIRSVDITTGDAYVEADFMNKSISIHRCSTAEFSDKNRNGVSYYQESLIERILVPNAEPLSLEIKNFVDCINQGCSPRPSVKDGINAIRLAKQICFLVHEQNQQYNQLNDLSFVNDGEIIDAYQNPSNR